MHRKLLCGAAAVAIATALSGPVVAADLTIPKAVPIATAVPVGVDWSGYYLGGHLGFGWASHSASLATDAGNFSGVDLSGPVLGFQSGYNWVLGPILGPQWGSWVVGIESDASITPWERSSGNGSDTGARRRLDWLGSIRGRLGMTFDSVLVYATGGIAFARGNSELNSTESRLAVRFTSVGAVVGGGIEWMYRPTLSFKLEGLHYMFDDSQTNGGLTDQLRSVSVIRWGANWHFGPGGFLPFGKGPVVGRY